MLSVYLERSDIPKDKKIIDDVELQFITVCPDVSANEQKMLDFIEHGSLISSASFKDRFDVRLPVNDLSTGCKTALCVLHYPDSVVDLYECGYNAVEAILRFCKNGNVLVSSNPTGFAETDSHVPVDIVCSGYHFTDYTTFNKYVKNWYPFPPDLRMGDIEKC